MQEPESATVIEPAERAGSSPVATQALFYGSLSAVAYTAATVCLRSVTGFDPFLISCIKAAPTAIATFPFVFLLRKPGQRILPAPRLVMMLVASGVLGQLCGNVAFQWALGVIGMALTVPLCMGSIIIGSAVLGRIYLNESIRPMTVAALSILIAAIWILTVGAKGIDEVSQQVDATTSLPVMLAVGAACMAGMAYAVLGVAIRQAVMNESSVAATTFCVALTGVLCLGPPAIARLGLERIADTPLVDFGVMVLAGVFNLVAFVALARALQITTLVYVNAVNASQVAMASLAGVLFFREQPSMALAVGVALTVFGLILMPGHRRREDCDDSLDRAS